MKLGRNSPCLCGSGKKYKACCLGKKDWDSIIARPDFAQHLTARGKNLFFLNTAASILDLDPDEPHIDWPIVKKKISEKHVFELHTLLKLLWSDKQDLQRTLSGAEGLSGLYTGHYTPEAMTRNLARHSLYTESILVFDPFVFPGSVNPEYDPVLHPEKYVSHTIKCLYIWFSMAPWIQAGILKFIRSPTDFDANLAVDSLREEDARLAKHKELREAMDSIKANPDIHEGEIGWMTEYLMLSYSDETIRDVLTKGGFSAQDINDFIRRRERDKQLHPYYTEQRRSDLLITKMGESYGVTKRVADLTGSFLLTDNEIRWKIIELDRKESGIDESSWEPFSRAIGNAPLKLLENISLEDCLRLRKDGLLNSMRLFLRRVWTEAGAGVSSHACSAQHFADELEHEVALAEDEWRQIDRKLMKWFGSEAAASLALAPQIGLANVSWLAASLAVAGVANLAESRSERRSLPHKMPGAFFLGCKHK